MRLTTLASAVGRSARRAAPADRQPRGLVPRCHLCRVHDEKADLLERLSFQPLGPGTIAELDALLLDLDAIHGELVVD